ncbi:MAG: hypothetical protein GKS01_16280 [Alphaproteobacteria bacterium]|nr:hypothetical protein [Alphaproteobacteria bacterium]
MKEATEELLKKFGGVFRRNLQCGVPLLIAATLLACFPVFVNVLGTCPVSVTKGDPDISKGNPLVCPKTETWDKLLSNTLESGAKKFRSTPSAGVTTTTAKTPTQLKDIQKKSLWRRDPSKVCNKN